MADVAKAARRRATTVEPGSFRLHDHVAWQGRGSRDLDCLAVATFRRAADRGDLMMFIAEEPQPERLAALDGLDALIGRDALQLVTVNSAYSNHGGPHGRLAYFESELHKALDLGFSGMCVVADNSQLAGGTDEEFAAWLAWEAMTDQLQADRPLNGVCYFDEEQLPEDRLADLAVVHPVLSSEFDAPTFQLFVDGDAVTVAGTLDHWWAEQLLRILADAPTFTELGLDLSEVEFVDHRALLALNRLGSEVGPIRLRGATAIVRKVWDLLDVASPSLEFC